MGLGGLIFFPNSSFARGDPTPLLLVRHHAVSGGGCAVRVLLGVRTANQGFSLCVADWVFSRLLAALGLHLFRLSNYSAAAVSVCLLIPARYFIRDQR